MNDEYIWQKTGEDPEVMRLEKALAAFRYRETAPPALPVVVTPPRTLRWRFPLVITTAAFAALVIAVGTWFQVTGQKDDYELIFIHHPAVEESEKPAVQETPTVQPVSPPVRQPVRRTHRVVQSAAASMPRRPILRTTSSRKPVPPILSKQERYAYERLLLALSISSSKINIVRNTINGVEENEKRPGQNNR